MRYLVPALSALLAMTYPMAESVAEEQAGEAVTEAAAGSTGFRANSALRGIRHGGAGTTTYTGTRTNANGEVTTVAGSSETTVERDGNTTTWQRTGSATVTRPDGETVTHDRSGELVVERNGNTTTWERRADRESSNGAERHVEASGERTNHGDGSGDWSREKRVWGERANGEGFSWERDVEGEWVDNEVGGRDSERVAVTNRNGKESTATTQRRTAQRGPVTAFVEATERTLANGEEVESWSHGQAIRQRRANGYVIRRVSRGETGRGQVWNREETEEVLYRDDGSRVVQQVVSYHAQGKPRSTVTTAGVYTRSEEGRGWTYRGVVETRENRRVTNTREIERTVRRLPIPANLEDIPADD